MSERALNAGGSISRHVPVCEAMDAEAVGLQNTVGVGVALPAGRAAVAAAVAEEHGLQIREIEIDVELIAEERLADIPDPEGVERRLQDGFSR